jgi:hypothetical protein
MGHRPTQLRPLLVYRRSRSTFRCGHRQGASFKLSLSHTHTHTHTHLSLSLSLSQGKRKVLQLCAMRMSTAQCVASAKSTKKNFQRRKKRRGNRERKVPILTTKHMLIHTSPSLRKEEGGEASTIGRRFHVASQEEGEEVCHARPSKRRHAQGTRGLALI